MKVTRIHTWWPADHADAVIGFIDELFDQLCATYGDQIIKKRLAETKLVNTRAFTLALTR